MTAHSRHVPDVHTFIAALCLAGCLFGCTTRWQPGSGSGQGKVKVNAKAQAAEAGVDRGGGEGAARRRCRVWRWQVEGNPEQVHVLGTWLVGGVVCLYFKGQCVLLLLMMMVFGSFAQSRTTVNLKDKWRNLLRRDGQ